jgi:hypothetical protein
MLRVASHPAPTNATDVGRHSALGTTLVEGLATIVLSHPTKTKAYRGTAHLGRRGGLNVWLSTFSVDRWTCVGARPEGRVSEQIKSSELI